MPAPSIAAQFLLVELLCVAHRSFAGATRRGSTAVCPSDYFGEYYADGQMTFGKLRLQFWSGQSMVLTDVAVEEAHGLLVITE